MLFLSHHNIKVKFNFNISTFTNIILSHILYEFTGHFHGYNLHIFTTASDI